MSSEHLQRAYCSADLPEILQLIRCSVLQLASEHYSAAQCRAWTAHLTPPPEPDNWDRHFTTHFTRLSQAGDGQLSAFICLRLHHLDLAANTAWLDCLFCAPRFAGEGLASELLEQAVRYARCKGRTAIETRASLCLAPILRRRGWRCLFYESVERQGQWLDTRRMRLEL